MIDPWFS